MKNRNSNLLDVYIRLPLKSKQEFLTVLSANKFKSITFVTGKMKYRKAFVRSFNVSTNPPEE